MPSTVLIPVVTGKESDKKFLYAAAGPAKKVVVVYLIDQSSGMTPIEMEQELKEKEVLLEQIKRTLRILSKPVKLYNEWGSIKEKIPVIAQREGAEEIVVQKRGKLGLAQINEIKELGIPVREVGA